ncbi:GNAT family N-acetyltransferase [Nonomuraea sp. B12E4]|uniref:GNAT family N-acetyltransferase n=1 Tax=Nonomuraea sp. B12E4 TaxID=3153564 RepID=UPI00325E0E4E
MLPYQRGAGRAPAAGGRVRTPYAADVGRRDDAGRQGRRHSAGSRRMTTEWTTYLVRAVPFDHPAAVDLRAAMTEEMNQRYGDRFSGPGTAPVTVEAGSVVFTGVAFDAGRAVGHILLRRLDEEIEIKRMYVVPSHRGSGVARGLLAAAERAARDLGAARVILHTGDRQPEAIRLYEREGYTRIPLYPPYTAMTYSTCFEKPLGGGAAASEQ